jgi:transcriptional regulator with XRE-family HTH domain
MLERIRTLLTARQLTPTQFADTIGVSRPIVSHILSGRNKPSLEVVQKIVGAFPDLSLRWLLNGEGPMVAVQALEPPGAPSRARQTAPEPPQSVVAPPAAYPSPVAAPELPPILKQPTTAPMAAAVSPVLPPPVSAVPAPETLPTAAAEPVVAPVAARSIDNKLVNSGVKESEPQPTPASAALAQGLAEPGKRIRRIVIFYQDGTFADYQPDAAS